ncbi:Ycf66 family protein, partial [Leptolyngbya sp. FACHB-36]|uniref:Ycf66 family protein n=1 Tax=Leptolyngbya sp. FACHB-36 TaxID=2692808 RepID=UPI0016816B61
MLAYLLALVVALGSFALYMAAFFFPEVHRKNDFIWSGVGLFYALVLWVCGERITGGVLLGQTASVALLGWLGWQTLT